MRVRHQHILALVALALLTSACSLLRQAVGRVATATVTFADIGGAPRGSAVLWQDLEETVTIELNLIGLPPGPHGIHFHAVGRCDNEGDGQFATAGPHFNPEAKRHGLSAVDGPHAGDLPNINVRSDGTLRATLTTDRVTLTAGPKSLLDSNGSALIVHIAQDDQITDPAGNSGLRLVCGVVESR